MNYSNGVRVCLYLYLLPEREADQADPAAGHVLLPYYQWTCHPLQSGKTHKGISNSLIIQNSDNS